MKKFIGLLLLAAGIFGTAFKADAQGLKLGIQGITFEPDTVVKESVNFHSAISVKKKEKSTALYIGGSKRSSIRLFEYGWNMLDKEVPGDWFEINNWKSQQVTINPFNVSITNAKGNVGLSMALGLRANNYRFESAYTMEEVGGMVNPVPIEGRIKKTKFTTAAIHIPAEFTIGKPSRFAVSMGGFADVVFNSHTKINTGEGARIRRGISRLTSCSTDSAQEYRANMFPSTATGIPVESSRMAVALKWMSGALV